jgi:peroxiredoxin
VPDDPDAPGWGVLHLFYRLPAPDALRRDAVVEAVARCGKDGHQVICASVLGHKADLAVMALGPDLRRLRALDTELRAAGLWLASSYVSLTEVSEYAAGIPEAMREARLHPVLPPEGMPWLCFYPMSKRRAPGAENWYALAYEERLALMHGHGAVGREFRGRVLQLVTGSTGLDDFEWGVTLFARTPDDLKACVYRMRFDEASARYAEFGPFLVGEIGTVGEVLERLGVAR